MLIIIHSHCLIRQLCLRLNPDMIQSTNQHDLGIKLRDIAHTARSAQRDPPQTCAWSGGDFNLAGSCACKVEVPPTSRFQVGGDFSSPGTAACKAEVPPTSSTSLGGITLGWPSCNSICTVPPPGVWPPEWPGRGCCWRGSSRCPHPPAQQSWSSSPGYR